MKYLDVVAREGSFRAAEAKAHVAASAIQRQIILFEEEIGTPIFERLPKGLRLTATGELLIAFVRQSFREEEQLLTKINALRGIIRDNINIATINGMVSSILHPVITEFQRQNPHVKIHIHSVMQSEVARLLIDGKVDFAWIYNFPNHARLHIDAQFKTRLGFVVAKNHDLAKKRKINFSDILDAKLIFPSHAYSLRNAIDVILPPSLLIEPILETNSIELMKKMVLESGYITILNEMDIIPERSHGDLIFVPITTKRAVQILTQQHLVSRPLKPAASLFSKAIIKHCEESLSIKENIDE